MTIQINHNPYYRAKLFFFFNQIFEILNQLYLCKNVFFWYHKLYAAAHLSGPDVASHELLHRPILLLLVLQVHPRDPVLVPIRQPNPESKRDENTIPKMNLMRVFGNL